MLDPGIHYGVDVAEYHRDPCAYPSLTQSTAKTILQQSPLHAWFGHPKLNPQYRPDEDPTYDIGNVAHAMLLGRGKGFVVVEGADSWRTKAAKEQRDAINASGKIGILEKTYNVANAMAGVARSHLANEGINWQIREESEVCLVWREIIPDGHRESSVMFRTLIDRLDARGLYDFKTTRGSAAPHVLQNVMIAQGWDIQAAMHMRGLRQLKHPGVEELAPTYIVQEAYPPYALTIARILDSAVALGGAKLQRAAEIWAECMRRDRWPGYGRGRSIELGYPDWALHRAEYDTEIYALEQTAEAMHG